MASPTGEDDVAGTLETTFRGIDLVCFDLFGTLVEITRTRRPFHTLIAAAPEVERSRLRRRIMAEDIPLAEIGPRLGLDMDAGALETARAMLEDEIASTRLRPGIADMLARLPCEAAICSNLASDYARVLEAIPEIREIPRILSFEVGAIKPEPEIYAAVCARTGVPAGRILFSGDTRDADIIGPAAYGMRSMPIDVLLARAGETA